MKTTAIPKTAKFTDIVGWVDAYVGSIRNFIRVREYDSLLIKIPNQSFKLNPSALRIMKRLLAGETIAGIMAPFRDREAVAMDIHHFFCDLKAVLGGKRVDPRHSRAVEEVRFGPGFNRLPVLSEIALTYRCNLACVFCYAACGCRKRDETPELGTDDIKRILNSILREAEVPSVSFTGGEPTLRQDLPEVVAHAKSLGMWVNLISNGTLITRELAGELKSAGLDSAQVSVEGGSAGLHDRIVKHPGAFVRMAQGIEHLRAAGVRIHTNTTLSALNKDCLGEIVAFVKARGLRRLSMNLLMPVGSAARSLKETFVSYSEVGPIVLQVQQWALEAGLEFMWYSPTPICLFNPITHGLGNKGCAACDGLLSVSPSGDILPCSSYPRPMGNMLENAGQFKMLWHSPEFECFQQKKFAHETCQACEHMAACNGGCPLYWQEVGYDEIVNRKEALA
jgi:radical SAM protein with 4Fe4S-binding SPASM domain